MKFITMVRKVTVIDDKIARFVYYTPSNTYLFVKVNYGMREHSINNLVTNYSWFLGKNSNSKRAYKLGLHSYCKKLFNSLTRHGSKLLSINAIFQAHSNVFLYAYSIQCKKVTASGYKHTAAFLYNIENYKWLRSSLALWAWATSWLDFIFKYTLAQKTYRAGHKKKMPSAKLIYIPPIKRPLIVYYFFKGFVKLSDRRLFKDRVSTVVFDTFFNFKECNLYTVKLGVYRRYIEKLTRR